MKFLTEVSAYIASVPLNIDNSLCHSGAPFEKIISDGARGHPPSEQHTTASGCPNGECFVGIYRCDRLGQMISTQYIDMGYAGRQFHYYWPKTCRKNRN